MAISRVFCFSLDFSSCCLCAHDRNSCIFTVMTFDPDESHSTSVILYFSGFFSFLGLFNCGYDTAVHIARNQFDTVSMIKFTTRFEHRTRRMGLKMARRDKQREATSRYR